VAANPLSLTVDSAASKRSWRSSVFSFASSILIQAGALAALALLPLFSMGALPEPDGIAPLPRYIPVVPVAKPLGARTEGKVSPSTPARSIGFVTDRFVHVPLSDDVIIDDGWSFDLAPGVPDGVLVGVVGVPFDPGTPAREAEAQPEPGPAVAGVDVAPPRKTRHVPPLYPPVAAAARIEGTVVLEAIIDHEGNVSNLRVVQSIPLLDRAALDAVRQWKYEPTRLNGRPVPVVMTVTVTFVLNP
jgi:protein TonB